VEKVPGFKAGKTLKKAVTPRQKPAAVTRYHDLVAAIFPLS